MVKLEIQSHFSKFYDPAMVSFYFSMLYSFYSTPNIILPLFGGVFSDQFGYRKMSFCFLLFICIGQTVLYVGSLMESLKLMILGRFIFGLGGESINITCNIILVKWFSGKELSLANVLV
jgi:MFS family permease